MINNYNKYRKASDDVRKNSNVNNQSKNTTTIDDINERDRRYGQRNTNDRGVHK